MSTDPNCLISSIRSTHQVSISLISMNNIKKLDCFIIIKLLSVVVERSSLFSLIRYLTEYSKFCLSGTSRTSRTGSLKWTAAGGWTARSSPLSPELDSNWNFSTVTKETFPSSSKIVPKNRGWKLSATLYGSSDGKHWGASRNFSPWNATACRRNSSSITMISSTRWQRNANLTDRVVIRC